MEQLQMKEKLLQEYYQQQQHHQQQQQHESIHPPIDQPRQRQAQLPSNHVRNDDKIMNDNNHHVLTTETSMDRIPSVLERFHSPFRNRYNHDEKTSHPRKSPSRMSVSSPPTYHEEWIERKKRRSNPTTITKNMKVTNAITMYDRDDINGSSHDNSRNIANITLHTKRVVQSIK
jgi:hypothetical protein